MHVAHPFRVDGRGRTAEADDEEYLRQLVELVLFTQPGERVNRPDFGTGLAGLVFEPNNEELHTAVEYVVQGGLQRWLGDVIQVEDVTVTHDDGALIVTVQYVTLRLQQRNVLTLRPPAAPA
jgi:phage baseplate assembly protein W